MDQGHVRVAASESRPIVGQSTGCLAELVTQLLIAEELNHLPGRHSLNGRETEDKNMFGSFVPSLTTRNEPLSILNHV